MTSFFKDKEIFTHIALTDVIFAESTTSVDGGP